VQISFFKLLLVRTALMNSIRFISVFVLLRQLIASAEEVVFTFVYLRGGMSH